MRAPSLIGISIGILMALSGAALAQDVRYDSEFPPAPSAVSSSGLASSGVSSSKDTSLLDRASAEPGPLPAAPSAAQEAVYRQRFRSQLDLVPGEPQRLTAQDKFHLFVEQTNSPFTFAAAGVSAGLSQATNSSPGFNQGWTGYGKRYGAALADSETSAFFTKFLIPVMARQDPRFKRNGKEPFLTRLFGAASQVVNTVDDDGDPAFNYSQVLGTVISASIANAYYPAESRGMRRTANRAVNGLGGAAGANVLREFWPDVKRLLIRRKVSQREIEALSWRTGSQLSIVPEVK